MGERIAAALGSLPFTAEAYEEAAADATGLSDFGHPYYREGLEILLRSLKEEADLTVVGGMMLQRSILLALQRRLYLVDLRKTQPAMFTKPLTPPLIVTGLPRSGTTFFHRLLAQDPTLRAPTLHELLQPLPLAERSARRLGRLRLAIELGVFRRMTPGLDARHFTRADEPEECMFAMCQSFRSFMFWSLAPACTHVAWYMRQSRLRKYRDYASILQALQSLAPEKRLLLKAPEHLGAVNEILTVIPGAMIVVCRRAPMVALASFNSLITTTHRTSSKSPDPRRIAQLNLDFLSREATRHAKGRQAHPGRVLDIDYDRIISDPVEATAAVYRHFGMELPPATLERFAAFAAANRQAKHGAHRYTTGYSPNQTAFIAARFKDYEDSRL